LGQKYIFLLAFLNLGATITSKVCSETLNKKGGVVFLFEVSCFGMKTCDLTLPCALYISGSCSTYRHRVWTWPKATITSSSTSNIFLESQNFTDGQELNSAVEHWRQPSVTRGYSSSFPLR